MFATTALLLIGTACTATRETSLAIVQERPSGDDNSSIIHTGGYSGMAKGHPDTTVESTWPFIQCTVRDGDVFVHFSARLDEWPQSWPSTATCDVGDESLVISLRAAIVPTVSTNNEITLPEGVTVAMPYPIMFMERILHLPTSHSYLPGAVTGQMDGADWEGVDCVVGLEDTTSEGYLYLTVDSSATEGLGFCTVDLDDGSELDIPIRLFK